MKKFIMSIFCLVLLSNTCSAQHLDKSIFLLHNVSKNAFASCVAIGYDKTSKNLLVLSAGHIVDEIDNLFFVIIDKKVYHAKLKGYINNLRTGKDISLMEVVYQKYIPLIKLSNNDKFMMCRLVGYAHGSDFTIKNSLFLSTSENNLYSIESVSIPGMSGGAVLNESGELIGTIVGHIQGEISIATNIHLIRKFVKKVLPEGYLTSIPLNKVS